MAWKHLSGGRGLAVQFIPVALNPFTVRASAAFGVVEREGAVTLLLVALEMELWD